MFEPDPRKRHIKLFFIIVGILCLALYPIWPLQLRILVFKVSFYLLIGLVSISLISAHFNNCQILLIWFVLDMWGSFLDLS